jgi:hypothetical protein
VSALLAQLAIGGIEQQLEVVARATQALAECPQVRLRQLGEHAGEFGLLQVHDLVHVHLQAIDEALEADADVARPAEAWLAGQLLGELACALQALCRRQLQELLVDPVLVGRGHAGQHERDVEPQAFAVLRFGVHLRFQRRCQALQLEVAVDPLVGLAQALGQLERRGAAVDLVLQRVGDLRVRVVFAMEVRDHRQEVLALVRQLFGNDRDPDRLDPRQLAGTPAALAIDDLELRAVACGERADFNGRALADRLDRRRQGLDGGLAEVGARLLRVRPTGSHRDALHAQF